MADALCKDDNTKIKKSNNNIKNYNSTTTTSVNNIKRCNEKSLQINLNKKNDCNIEKLCEKSLQQRSSLSSSSLQSVSSAVGSSSVSSLSSSSLIDNNIKHQKTNNFNNKRDSNNKNNNTNNNSTNNNKNKMNNVVGGGGGCVVKNSQLTAVSSASSTSSGVVSLSINNNISKITDSTASITTSSTLSSSSSLLLINHNNCSTTKELLNNNNCKSGNVKKCNTTTTLATTTTTTTSFTNNNSTNLVSNIKNNNNNNKLSGGSISGSGLTTSVTNLNSNNLNNCVMISGNNNNNNNNNSGINGAKQQKQQQQQICNQGLSSSTTTTTASSSSSKLSIPGVTITPTTFSQPISVTSMKNCNTNLDLHNKMDKKCIGNGGTTITGSGIKSSSLEHDTEDNRNKKKRCSDRYDSSESSDSGVATLSCTDSSTASSDASDPGSPYSPVSLGDDVHHQTATTQSSGKVNMPPQTILTSPPVAHQAHHHHHHHHSTAQQQQQQTSTLSSSSSSATSVSSSPSSIVKHLQQHHQQLQHLTQKWPWNTTVTATTSITSNNNNNINNSNNFNANNNNNKSSNNNNIATGNKHKRLSINTSDTNNTAKKVRTNSNNINSLHHTNVVENNNKLHYQNTTTTTTTANSVAPSAAKRLKSSATSVIDDVSSTSLLSSASPSAQQTKITGYFKSQMKPLNGIKKDIPNIQQQQLNQFNQQQQQQQQQQTSPLPPIPIGLDKYFNILTKNKDDKDQSQKLSSVKNYDVRNIQSILPPSLKKIERKTTKIAQVAPNPRKTSSLRPKSPKKHIAIAPRTAEMKKNTNATARKLSASSTTTTSIHNQLEAQQSKISQPTVLLTAIRIPQANAQPAQVQTSSQTPSHHHQQTVSAQNGITTTTSTVATATTTAAKIGSTQVFQIPVMPNLVQIPNILATNAGNLVMNNGQLARMGNGAQYFLNGTVIKLQQIVASSNANDPNGNNNVNTNLLTMESGLQGNILVKPPTIAQAMPLAPTPTGAAMSTTKPTTQQQTSIMSHSQTPINANGINSTATITGIHHQGPNFSTSQRLSAQPVFMATTSGLLLNAATLPTAVIATAKLPGLPQVIPALQPIQSHTQNSATASILPNLSTILHSNTSTAQFIVNHSEPPALTSMSNTVTQLSSTGNGNFVTSKTIASVAGTQTSVVAANTISSVPPPLVTLASTRDSAAAAVTAGLMRQKLSSNNFISSDLKENNSTTTTEKSSQLQLKLLSPPPLISTINGTEDASLRTARTNVMTTTTTTLNAKEPILPHLVPTNDNHLHHPYVIDILKSFQQQQQQRQQPQQQQFLPPTLISTTSFSSLSSVINNHNKSVEMKDPMKLCLPSSTKDNVITTVPTITTTTTAPTKLTVLPDAFIYGKDEFIKFEKFNERTFKEEVVLKKENDDELLKNEIKCESMFDFDEELEHEVTKAAKIAAAVAAETLKDSDDFKIEEKLFKLEPFKPEKFELGNICKIKELNCIDTNHNDDDSSIKPISEESSLSNESCVDSQQSQSLTHQLLLDATQETNVTTLTLTEDVNDLNITTPTIITPIITDIETNNLSLSSFSLQKCAISPILSQPKTIRFPVIKSDSKNRVYRIGTKGAKRCHDGICYWDNCNEKYDTSSKLLDHLQQQHVNTQDGPFQCLWNGCKVHGRESCSRRWLERHVLSHGGTKPFKCIVDGCGLRFGSQLALQKHVNGHFNNVESKDNQSKRTSDPPIPKLLRKNGKKLRYRRQPFSARMFDFFDSGIMEGLQHRLMITGSLANGPKGSVTFKGQTIAKRTTIDGVNEVFVRWNPYEIIPDEWVPESKNALIKTISIHDMHFEECVALKKQLNHANLHKDINTIFNRKKSLISSSSLALSLSDDTKQIRRHKQSRKSSNMSWSSIATPSSSSSSSSSSLSSSSSISSFCSSASYSTPSQSSSSLFKLFKQQPS